MFTVHFTPLLENNFVSLRFNFTVDDTLKVYLRSRTYLFYFKENRYEVVKPIGFENIEEILLILNERNSFDLPLFELNGANRDFVLVAEFAVSSNTQMEDVTLGNFIESENHYFKVLPEENAYKLITDGDYISMFTGDVIDTVLGNVLSENIRDGFPTVYLYFKLKDSYLITSNLKYFKARRKSVIAPKRNSIFTGKEIDDFVTTVLGGDIGG